MFSLENVDQRHFSPTHAVTIFFFYIEISYYYKIQESNVFFEKPPADTCLRCWLDYYQIC